MIKKIISLMLVLSAFLILTSCGESTNTDTGSTELNILTWDGYIPQDVLDAFSESENVKINISNFDSNEEMLAKISTGNSGYDLVIGSDYIIDIARKQDLLMELDKNLLPNYSNLSQAYLSKDYDPENKYTVPYSVGTPVIVYDPAKIQTEIKGYNDLWDESLKGKVLLLDDPRNIIGITLKSMNESMNTTDEQILQKAKDKLFKLKENVHHLDYNAPHESIISGETDIAYLFTSQAFLALEARPELKVVYPEEGIGFGIDCWFIPKGAKNTDNAHKLMNMILDAETGAKITEAIMYPTPNAEAHKLLPDALKNNVLFNIPAEKLKKAEFIEDIGDSADAYTKIWADFKQQ